ncbi:MAG: GNAT family N-acetyltransferase [Planctomycetota bacterium]|nr:GNAT family N-acetyltransferase [Planctomycetota bacterium]
MIQITVMPHSDLEQRHLKAWSRIQDSDSTFASPFFRPEFTTLVASVRDDICVGVLEQNEAIVGFFPFQEGRCSAAEPVGGDISQFHGVIVERGVEWNVEQLLRGCRLNSWAFDHLPTSQTPFQRYHYHVGSSPCIDLTNGFKAYCDEKKKSGRAIEQAFRKERKLEREVGRLRFELHDTSDETFRHLLDWKSEQHRRTNVVDAFQDEWLVNLLDRIRLTQSASFAGLMSVLFAGDQLVAVHLGMRSKSVAHLWYPAYDTAFGKHSPGITLLLKMAEALADDGVQRIDFAARQQIYKERFMSGAIPVALGVADRSRLRSCVRRNTNTLRERMRETPLAAPIRGPVRLIRRVGNWWADR